MFAFRGWGLSSNAIWVLQVLFWTAWIYGFCVGFTDAAGACGYRILGIPWVCWKIWRLIEVFAGHFTPVTNSGNYDIATFWGICARENIGIWLWYAQWPNVPRHCFYSIDFGPFMSRGSTSALFFRLTRLACVCCMFLPQYWPQPRNSWASALDSNQWKRQLFYWYWFSIFYWFNQYIHLSAIFKKILILFWLFLLILNIVLFVDFLVLDPWGISWKPRRETWKTWGTWQFLAQSSHSLA